MLAPPGRTARAEPVADTEVKAAAPLAHPHGDPNAGAPAPTLAQAAAPLSAPEERPAVVQPLSKTAEAHAHARSRADTYPVAPVSIEPVVAVRSSTLSPAPHIEQRRVGAMPTPAGDPSRRAATRRWSEPLRAESAARSGNEPSLLIPATAGGSSQARPDLPAAPPPRQAAWSQTLAPAGAADDPTEVHIHIGRIDVTAVHDAPKVRVKPTAKSPSLSLDAYLAGRSKA